MGNLRNSINNILGFWKFIILGILITFILQKVVFIIAYIPSESMESTLNVGDRVISYSTKLNTTPKRGDIVVFRPNFVDELWIKRVVGVGGDKVKITDGKVYINNKEIDEPYVSSESNYSGSFTVPKDKYLLLGDNRGNSVDARFWGNPYVDKEQIEYIALVKIYPIKEIKLLR